MVLWIMSIVIMDGLRNTCGVRLSVDLNCKNGRSFIGDTNLGDEPEAANERIGIGIS